MLKREVESWVYNLMLAAQVECWGLKLIFGSLSRNSPWSWNVKLKVGCYNLMFITAQVESWGLKLIFGSLSWIINFECWNVKLKVECYNLMLAGQVECWGLKLIFGGDWTPYNVRQNVSYVNRCEFLTSLWGLGKMSAKMYHMSIVANSSPRREDSVKSPPKCIICHTLTIGSSCWWLIFPY